MATLDSPRAAPGAAPHPSSDVKRADELLTQLQHTPAEADRQALRDEIVTLTIGVADSAARTFWYRGIERNDLTQVARLGLMKAIRGYDPSVGAGFVAYALPTITGELKRYFRDQGWLVRPPRSLQEMRPRLGLAQEALRARLGREPTQAELAAWLEVEEQVVTQTRLASRGFTAEPLGPPQEEGQGADCAAADTYREIEERESVRPALHSLTDRQRTVLRLRFVDDLTQAEIGARVGVSQMQVSRILSGCLAQLREQVHAA